MKSVPQEGVRVELMSARAGWLPSLDGLRALSILVVMFSHLVDGRLAPGGFGVATFFMISGFLISRLLLAEHKKTDRIDLPRFYLRRFLRLYPAMAVYIGVVVVVYLLGGHKVGWTETIATLTYTGNYVYVWLDSHLRPMTMPFGIFWSLSVEEHFYLLMPPLLLLLGVRPGRLFWAMVIACGLELGWRIWNVRMYPGMLGPSAPTYYRTDFRLDSLAVGVALTAALETARGRRIVAWLGRPWPAAAAAAALLSTFLLRDPAFRETWRYTLQGVALVILLSAILFQDWTAPVQTFLNAPPLVWIGRLSYSLYIWHLATPEITRTLFPGASLPVQWAVCFALSFALAALSYYAVETPVLNLRRRLGSIAGRRAAAKARA